LFNKVEKSRIISIFPDEVDVFEQNKNINFHDKKTLPQIVERFPGENSTLPRVNENLIVS